MKFKIAIEETFGKEFEIEADNFYEAIKIAENKYINGEIALLQKECKFKQMSVVYPKNEITEWIEF